MKKIAIFDVCETLISIQTADYFTNFILNKFKYRGRRRVLLLLETIKFFVFTQKYFPNWHIEKKLRLFSLKGISKNKLEEAALEFYHELIVNYKIDQTFKEFTELQMLGNSMILLSAGYDVYLQFLAKHLNAQLICNKLVFRNNKFTGFIEIGDCSGENKVHRVKSFLSSINLEGINAIAYGDSYEDRFILNWAADGVLVLRSGRKNWDLEGKYRVISWH